MPIAYMALRLDYRPDFPLQFGTSVRAPGLYNDVKAFATRSSDAQSQSENFAAAVWLEVGYSSTGFT